MIKNRSALQTMAMIFTCARSLLTPNASFSGGAEQREVPAAAS
jgi:hypothetical protein